MDILELVHEDRSSASRPFACQDPGCYKAFARRSDLVRHIRIHSNERPWICEWPGCERDFIQRSALTVHMRVHTGERPHKCEYDGCDKAFSDSSSLARHRRIHTGKRPYKCPDYLCGKTFCRKTTLTKHIKKHHPSSPQFSHGSFDSRPTLYEDAGSPSSSPPTSPSSECAEAGQGYYMSDARDQAYDYPPHLATGAYPALPSLPTLAETPRPQRSTRQTRASGMVGGWAPPVSNVDHSRLRQHLEEQEGVQQTAYATPPQHPRHMREFYPHAQHYDEREEYAHVQNYHHEQQHAQQYPGAFQSPPSHHREQFGAPPPHPHYLPTPATTAYSGTPGSHSVPSTPHPTHYHSAAQHHGQTWSQPLPQTEFDWHPAQVYHSAPHPSYQHHQGYHTAPLPSYASLRSRHAPSISLTHPATSAEAGDLFLPSSAHSSTHTGLGITLSPHAPDDLPSSDDHHAMLHHNRRFSDANAEREEGDAFRAGVMMSPTRGVRSLALGGGYSGFMSATIDKMDQELLEGEQVGVFV